MMRPGWQEHITVIRDEPPPDELKHLWECYVGEEVEFWYNPEVDSNDTHHWLDVVCERALDIREELGLARDPEYPLHLTVGTTHGTL